MTVEKGRGSLCWGMFKKKFLRCRKSPLSCCVPLDIRPLSMLTYTGASIKSHSEVAEMSWHTGLRFISFRSLFKNRHATGK